MNQEKIGKFIAKSRKKKNLTQEQLAERLGVSDRTVGNWENGRNMPDLSLFKPLCDELGITINEFLSGEEISKKDYQEKFEENIINTIDYSNNKIKMKSNIIGLLIIILGIFISILALSIFKSESSWGAIFSIFGGLVSTFGLFTMIRINKIIKKIIICIIYFILFILLIVFIDFLSVVNIKQPPRFRITTTYLGDAIYYDNLFYDVIRCYVDEPGETFEVKANKSYKEEDIINYCKNLSIKRIKESIKDTDYIIVAKEVFEEDDSSSYMIDNSGRRMKITNQIKNKNDIDKIVNVVKNASYPDYSNLIEYTDRFYLYKGDELIADFTRNEINTKQDNMMFYILDNDFSILQEYIKE